MGKLAHRNEEPQADILRRHPLHEPRVEPLILGPDRANEHLARHPRVFASLPIGSDRALWRMARAGEGGVLDLDPRIESDHAFLIDQKRIDIEFANSPVLHGKHAQLDEAERKSVQIDGGPVPEPFQATCRCGSMQ